MSFNNHSWRVNRTAHYSTFGILSKKTRYIWIFLHGYGQLAKKAIKKFEFLDTAEHFIIAPEGLSRFYWHTNNEPVASWMTKEDRYDEIEDFVNYLDDLYGRHVSHVNQKVQVIIMGFSQGCATAWRWIHARQPKFDVLVNWAGWIPEDISYLQLKTYLKGKKIYLKYGDKDKFITPEMILGIQDVIKANELDVRIESFEGDHKMPVDILEKFVRKEIL